MVDLRGLNLHTLNHRRFLGMLPARENHRSGSEGFRIQRAGTMADHRGTVAMTCAIRWSLTLLVCSEGRSSEGKVVKVLGLTVRVRG